MKKIKIYTLVLLVSFFATGCSDWLDGAQPKDKNLEDKQFSTEIGINSVMNGLYRSLADENLYGGKLTITDIELLAHYYYYEEDLSSKPNMAHFNYVSNYQYTTKEAQKIFSDIWTAAYKSIFNVNDFIKHVEQSTVAPEDRKKILLGEAYGLRAFIHLDLFRLFGDKTAEKTLPYNQSPEVIPHERISADEFFTLLLQDINTAQTLLDNDPIRTEGKILDLTNAGNYVSNTEIFATYLRNYRMNYYAVLALKARALMFKGEVPEAAQVANTVLRESFSENAGSGKPFYWVDKTKIEADGNRNYIFYTEVLFGINNLDIYTRWENYTNGTLLGQTYTVYYENLQNNIYRNDYTTGDISLWEDVRAKQWTPSKIGLGQYVSRKFEHFAYDSINDPKEYFQPLIRMSEMHYIVAEDHIRKGQVQEAVHDLNIFRFHRGSQYGSLPDEAATTEAQAYDILETEYYKEFFGEGQA
ncbi:MAG: RagB/SusD family nutrient uptake outer membrane protein, partial [Candidatus Symbiothrix sp.]|nr:RagB/SusD family nutrient uptake outer membrane protein [Candidatus Symbiothrix sp.]